MHDMAPIPVHGEVLTIDDTIDVVAHPHPFTTEHIDFVVQVGDTVGEILHKCQPDPILRRHAHIFIGDDYILKENWDKVRPKPGSRVSIRVVPTGGGGGGGGGKSTLRIVLLIAVIALAVAAPYLLGPTLAGTALIGTGAAAITIGQVVTSAVLLVGGLLVNALVPPPKPKLNQAPSLTNPSDSPTLFITGARNQFFPFGVIPRPLGRSRMVPPYGALPFTEVDGDAQFIRMLFIWGYGPLEISDLRIGETSLDEFDEVEIETIAGTLTDPVITLFTQDVFEESLQILLSNASGWNLRTTQQAVDEISIDLTFAGGLVSFGSTGGRSTVAVAFKIQYAPTGTQNWKGVEITEPLQVFSIGTHPYNPVSGGGSQNTLIYVDQFTGKVSQRFGTVGFTGTPASTPVVRAGELPIALVNVPGVGETIAVGDITDLRETGAFKNPTDYEVTPDNPVSTSVAIAAGTIVDVTLTVSARTTSAVRRSMRWQVVNGQYDVRIQRTTADATSETVRDAATLTALRSITAQLPVQFDTDKPLAMTALRIRATEQLQGIIDRFNGVVHSILPDWDSASSTWITRATSNPASCLRDVLQGVANARPLQDARVDLVGLQDWHEFCTAGGFEFDQVIDFNSSVDGMLDAIASVGRASKTLADNKWSVIIDQAQSIPVQFFTPKNSWSYSGQKIFTDLPHGFRVRFINRDKDWKQDERIVLDDGYVLSNPGPGETLATKFEVLELPGVTDPAIVWKHGRFFIAVARLRPEVHTFSVDPEYLVCQRGNLVEFSHDVPAIGLGYGRVTAVTQVGLDFTRVNLDERVPMELGKNYSVRFRYADATSSIHDVETTIDSDGRTEVLVFKTPIVAAGSLLSTGDLFMFGELESVTSSMVVKSIAPQGELAATLVCIDAAPAIHTADTGVIPTFNSNITPTLGSVAPAVIQVVSDESVLVELPNGVLIPSVVYTLGFTGNRPSEVTQIEVEHWPTGISRTDAPLDKHIFVPTATEIRLEDVIQGESYDTRMRFVLPNGAGPWSATITHVVIGMTTPPPDVLTLSITGTQLSWAYPNAPRDLDGFQIRFQAGSNTQWSTAALAHEGLISDNSFPIDLIPLGQRTIMVKAVDKAGNESVNAASLITDFGVPATNNIVITDDKDAQGFPGQITNGAVASSDLLANDAGALYLSVGSDLYLGGTTQDAALYLPVTYLAMTYITSFNPDVANLPGIAILEPTVTGTWTLEYRKGTDGLYLGGAAADSSLYLGGPSADTSPYLPATWSADYLTWPGNVAMEASEPSIEFRLITIGGAIRGIINEFNIILDVPDESESFNDIVLAAGGSRLTLTKTYRSIKNVSATLQDDGGAAVSIKIMDKNSTLGPLLQAFNASDVGTGATIDATIQGIKG